MIQLTQPAPRVHHFYVAIAKYLFLHPEHGVVSAHDPIRVKDAERYGLRPILLYGLTVAGLPTRWLTFTPFDRPRPFLDILQEAWRDAEGLRGQPDVLLVNRHLTSASPKLTQNLARVGVQVEIATAQEKRLPASLRSAQDASRWLLRKPEEKDLSSVAPLQALSRYAHHDHARRLETGFFGVSNREVEAQIQRWLALPMRMPMPAESEGLDWQPGPWLTSWEASLPPEQPRTLQLNGFDDRPWLLSDKDLAEVSLEEDDAWRYQDHDNAAAIAKNLLACWPNPPAEIAECAGITLRDLQWFTAGKISLEAEARLELEALLGIVFDERMGEFAGVGPYVLIARHSQAIKETYEALTMGGDARPREIVPRHGEPDPSWRYIVIRPYDAPPSIVMAPRGAKITERLPALLLNYEGVEAVDPAFYRDVVSTCARACRDPVANLREMRGFMQRHENRWEEDA